MLEKPKSKGENSGKVLNNGAPTIVKHYQKQLVVIANRNVTNNFLFYTLRISLYETCTFETIDILSFVYFMI